MKKTIDCVLCGSCVADILIRPFPVDTPIGAGKLIYVDPVAATTGGMVNNAGIAMTRLGMQVAAFGYVGNDEWEPMIRRRLDTHGVDTSHLLTHPTARTSTAAVLIDPSGERSFGYGKGATEQLDAKAFLDHLDFFAQCRMAMVGYYSFLPNLEEDLPEVLAAIRKTGCRTALDAAGDGGGLEPLDRILPHLDVYVPSHAEAVHQTGEDDPRKILEVYRDCGAGGLLGVKLGSKGALLSPAVGEYLDVDCVPPPGEVVDTTGAGDSFYAGLLTGLLKEMCLEDAARLAAAAGAFCVTGVGATAGVRDFDETARLAGLSR